MYQPPIYQPPALPSFDQVVMQRVRRLKWSVLWLLFASMASGVALLFFLFSFLIIPIFFGALFVLVAVAMLVVSLAYAIGA